MSDFGVRNGFEVEKSLQIKDLDRSLRNHIWSQFSGIFSRQDQLLELIIINYFYEPIDEFYVRNGEYFNSSRVMVFIKDKILNDTISVVCGLLEFVIVHHPGFQQIFNPIFSEHKFQYQFIDGLITPITDELEIQSIEKSLEILSPFVGARGHIQTALKMLSDRKNPDYRNSIKESISAVEAIVNLRVNSQNVLLK
ncbi:MAG: hypothetical protein PHH70_02870 [Candidatus Gracilibacteria bacterium]|nr:hypothetical protein [Candidatus Gracilibacteria bacterium]